jgi:sugar lactone lactonase YvrE
MTTLAVWFTAYTLAVEPPVINSYAGTGQAGYAGDGGPAAKATLNGPFDVAITPAGHVYFSDTSNHCVRRVDGKTGVVTTVAGTGKKGYTGDGGPATQATFNEPYGVELDAEGNLYIVDRLNYCVRVVEATSQKIRTLAGTGKAGYSGDGGPAAQAQLREPNGIALDGKGKLYIADVADQRLRVVDLKSGTIATFCGTGKKASLGDGGLLAEASLFGPRAVAVAPDGAVYVVEREGHRVRKIDVAKKTITAFAGTGKKGYTGDGGPALAATFNGPKEIDIDRNGNLFIVDTENEVIRRIDATTGKITTVAGNGKRGNTGNAGVATAATLGRPHGVCVGADGAIYIGDTLSHQVRVVR